MINTAMPRNDVAVDKLRKQPVDGLVDTALLPLLYGQKRLYGRLFPHWDSAYSGSLWYVIYSYSVFLVGFALPIRTIIWGFNV